MKNKTIVVWFSCGAASAIAAKKTIEIFGANNNIRVVNTPVKEEHHDNRRFLKDVENWLNCKIEIATAKDTSAVDVWKRKNYISGIKGAPCTTEIKKGARYKFEEKNKIDFHVLGYTVEEYERHLRFVKYERPNLLPVLICNGITKKQCFNELKQAGILLPSVYNHLPNANCIGCGKATSPTYWNAVRKNYPEIFEQRAKLSRQIGAKLVRYKGNRMFLDELPANAKGGKMQLPDCNIFCEL